MVRTKRGLSNESAAQARGRNTSTLKKRREEAITDNNREESSSGTGVLMMRDSDDNEDETREEEAGYRDNDNDKKGSVKESEDVGDKGSKTSDVNEEGIHAVSKPEAIDVEEPGDLLEEVEYGFGEYPPEGLAYKYREPSPDYTRAKTTRLRLRSSQFFSSADYGQYNFNRFGSKYAKFRHLTHLWMWGVGGVHVDEGGPYDIPYRAGKKLTHLKMTTCQLSTSVLTRMIGFSDNCLKSFTYHAGGLHDSERSCRMIQPGDIWAVLDGHNATLEKVDIDFDTQLDSLGAWMDEDAALYNKHEVSAAIEAVKLRIKQDGQWPEFPNLKCLRIGIEALMGLTMPPNSKRLSLVDGLPSNLEELTIRGYDANAAREDYVQQIEELLDYLPTKLPQLTKLEGIDECIPSGRDVYESDDEYDDNISEKSIEWSDNSDGY